MSSMSPWQCGLHNSKDRDNALFLNEKLSDLTIVFPYHKISFPAHRLMLAKTSPYFENLFYGPMAIHDQEWKVKDNGVEPEVFKIVLAHCYEVNLLDVGVEMTLQVYKLADFYIIESLKSQCLELLQDSISNKDGTNIQHIIEYSSRYNLFGIEDKVLEIMASKLNIENTVELEFGCGEMNKDIQKNVSNLLWSLPVEKRKEFLSRCEHLDVLFFEESWRHPAEFLSNDVLMSIFESSSCKNDCKKELFYIKGCISPKILIQFINIKRLSIAPYTHIFPKYDKRELHAYISIIDEAHSKALCECIKNHECFKDDADMHLCISLHIPCNKVSPKSLAIWSPIEIQWLYLSNVDDLSLQWVVDTVMPLDIYMLCLPSSKITPNGFRSLLGSLESREGDFNIDIFSCSIGKEYELEFNELRGDTILFETDEMTHW